jgi:hypothetical protein
MQNENTFEELKQAFLPENNPEGCLPTWTAAVWGAFLHEGLMDSIGNPRDKAILGNWKLGCIELVQESSVYLSDIWDELFRQYDPNDACCGVFEYEVVVAFGHYFGNHILLNNGQFPSDREIRSVIQTLVYSFLESNAATQ